MSSEYEKLDVEYARKHWVSQNLHGYPIPSEIRHQWRLMLMDLETRMEKFWSWGWMIAMLGIAALLWMVGCSTVEKTSEEMRESWYKACVETSNMPGAAKEVCEMRADKIIFGE